jgi:hypothetical protein
MTCDPLLRWAMPFSTAGYHAVPLDLVCPVYYPAIQPSYTAFRPRLFTSAATIGPAAAMERIEAAKKRGYPPAKST